MYFEDIFWMVDRVDNMLQNILSYIFDFSSLEYILPLSHGSHVVVSVKLCCKNCFLPIFFEREASFFISVHIIPEFLSGIRFNFLYKQIIHGFMKYKNMQ